VSREEGGKGKKPGSHGGQEARIGRLVVGRGGDKLNGGGGNLRPLKRASSRGREGNDVVAESSTGREWLKGKKDVRGEGGPTGVHCGGKGEERNDFG